MKQHNEFYTSFISTVLFLAVQVIVLYNAASGMKLVNAVSLQRNFLRQK